MLTNEEIIKIFKENEVMLEGHFLLTSGRHSDKYMQCAKLFTHPKVAELICAQFKEKVENWRVDLVAGPAVGGIIMAYEMSRQLGVPNIFAERENGKMTFRRGFYVPEDARVLITEDVVTTGGSVKEVIKLIEDDGGIPIGVGSIVDRSNGAVDFGIPFEAVLRTEVISYTADECPLCKQGIPSIKPGSRSLK